MPPEENSCMKVLRKTIDHKVADVKHSPFPNAATLRATLVSDLKHCRNLQTGKLLHSTAVQTGCHKNKYVATALLSMYSRCGCMLDARNIFQTMVDPDVVSWSSLILGYVENGDSLSALEVFYSMDCKPSNVTFVAALKACAGLVTESRLEKRSCLAKGVTLHREVAVAGSSANIFVANTLVDLYGKCGDLQRAQHVFDRIAQPDVVSWSALILAYVDNGESEVALDVFARMDCSPDRISFVAALRACASLASVNRAEKERCLATGRSIHAKTVMCGLDRDVFVGNTLVDMYCKCGDVSQARALYNKMPSRDVVSTSALILGYVENGESEPGLEVFERMECSPNSVTFVAALKACVGLLAENKLDKETCLEKGQRIHRLVTDSGTGTNIFVGNALIDMYSKLGEMSRAHDVFNRMITRDVVTWSALMLGYVENGESFLALDLYHRMDYQPDRIVFFAALKACASLGVLEVGQRIHSRVRDLGLEEDEMVASCLIDFYGKCGSMPEAEEVFKKMKFRDLVSWTALIGGYSQLGDAPQVFHLVKRMHEAGLQMDNVTMQLILTACSHAGMVEEGQRYFDWMAKCGISPSLEHYTCVVDMLGRSCRLEEALSLINCMPFKANARVWMSLLAACNKWRNLAIGKVAFQALLSLDKENVADAYPLMQKIYEKSGTQHEKQEIEMELEGKARSQTWWWEADRNVMHVFSL